MLVFTHRFISFSSVGQRNRMQHRRRELLLLALFKLLSLHSLVSGEFVIKDEMWGEGMPDWVPVHLKVLLNTETGEHAKIFVTCGGRIDSLVLLDKKSGMLRSILEGILLDTMFDLPGMQGVDEVMIDKDVVDGRKEPIRVYAENAKKKAGDAA